MTRAILASVLVATVLVTIGSALRETSRQLTDQRDAVLAVASTLATSISSPVERRDVAEIGARLNAIRSMRGITFAIVVDSNGRRLFEAGSGVVLGSPATPMIPNQELSLFGSLRLSTYLVSTPIISGGRNVGQLSLIADLTRLRAALIESVSKALLSGLAAALFGIMLSTRLRKSITGPILDLAREAETIRKSADYARTVPLQSDDEIGQLVDCFNAMMREIDLRNGKIEAQRDGLAETVRERTKELLIARDAAERANAAKSDFLATMSHEIRTPMNAMLVMTELLAAENLSEEARRRCHVILKAGRALHAVINDVLDLSKIEAGQLVVEYVKTQPRVIVEDVAALFADRASAAGLSLRYEVADEVPLVVVGDPLRLQQVLSNLVSNALKFTRAGDVVISVDVTSGSEARFISFAVTDSGIGLSPNQIGHIFEAFAQADASTSRQYGGTGIGLTICRKLALAMNGAIRVDSVLGQGSKFTLELPLLIADQGTLNDANMPRENDRKEALTGSTYEGLRILAADDNEANREVLSSVLERFGASVTMVENGADAIAEHQRDPYDLIFMDGSMPVLDGFEATRRIRALEAPGRLAVPIIALTAQVRNGGVDQWREAGMSDFVLKPFTMADIANVLQKWSGRRGDESPRGLDDPRVPVAAEQTPSPLIDTEILRNIAMLGKDGSALLIRVSQMFCQQSPERSRDLRAKVSTGDSLAIGRSAHALKSLSLNVGARKVGALCDEIEKIAAAGGAVPPDILQNLTDALDATVIALPDASRGVVSELNASRGVAA